MKGLAYLVELSAVLGLLASGTAAVQSTITEVEGFACMGENKSREKTRQAALTDARHKASEFVATLVARRIKAEHQRLKENLVSAYSKATVKVIRELDWEWSEEPGGGLCYRATIQAEVIPHEQDMAQVEQPRADLERAGLPLQVRIWTDKARYRKGETVKVHLKGSKPFYARIIHRDAHGKLLQLLPNPYRRDNYFEGGVIYQIPSGPDRFELQVTPPTGKENITLYASTAPMGEIDIANAGPVYAVRMPSHDVPRAVRGLKNKGLIRASGRPDPVAAEFVEAQADIHVVE